MTRHLARLVLMLAVVAGCGKKSGPPAPAFRAVAGDVAIVGATVVPMDREGTLAGHTVVIRGDRIVAVAPAATVDVTAATVLDGKGQWVLPGLADMHVHLWSERDFGMFLLNGVTTVRNLFGSPEHVRWRDQIAAGTMDGPTMFTAGPILDGDPPVWPGSDVVTTVEAARAAVVAQKQAGYDWLKVYNGLAPEVYDAILDEGKRQGMMVAGHVPKAVGIEKVLASGQRTIEHLDGYVPFFGEPATGDLIAPTVKAGVWNCPTLVVTDRFGRLDHPERLAGTRGLELVSPGVLAAWDPASDFRLKTFTPEKFESVRQKNVRRRALVKELHDAGAHLVLGTDTGNPYVIPGFAVVDELELLVSSGLTPWQALRTATVAAAELEGTPGAFGAVVVGARADLIVVGKDPLAAARNVADPAIVIVRGKVHTRAALMAAVTKPAATIEEALAAMPALEPEGTETARGDYAILMGDRPIGRERAVLSKLADGTVVVRGQSVYTMPRLVSLWYRATRDGADLTTDGLDPAHVVVTRKDAVVSAVQDGKAAVELTVPAGAVVAPQTVAEFVWYVPALADLPVGGTRALAAAEVMTDGGLALHLGQFTFTRVADDAGRRAYDLAGRHGDLDLTGRLVVDADGLPAEVTATVKFGTFVTRRQPVAP